MSVRAAKAEAASNSGADRCVGAGAGFLQFSKNASHQIGVHFPLLPAEAIPANVSNATAKPIFLITVAPSMLNRSTAAILSGGVGNRQRAHF